MIKLKSTQLAVASHTVHAASSERSRENGHLCRLDLAFAARMYVSSIDYTVSSTKIRLASCSFWSGLIVVADNAQNGYVAEGTRNPTTLNSVALTLYAR